jgi:MoxR-like ATPase
MFGSREELEEKLARVGYVSDPVTIQTVYLASRMNKPILVEGPAGSGKTELAYAVAWAAETRVERLQCYEGINAAAAIGSFDPALQKLFLETQAVTFEKDWASVRQTLHTLEFFVAGPLLRALIYEGQSCVLLIDELDKVDPAFEALLLEILSAWQLSIPKLGTIQARTIPFAVLTSNAERAIGDPLRRRSFYLRFDYPTIERERGILASHMAGSSEERLAQTAAFAKAVRMLSLSKPPSISEILELAKVLELLKVEAITSDLRDILLPVLVKTEEDRQLLLINDQWQALIYDAGKYGEALLKKEGEQCSCLPGQKGGK